METNDSNVTERVGVDKSSDACTELQKQYHCYLDVLTSFFLLIRRRCCSSLLLRSRQTQTGIFAPTSHSANYLHLVVNLDL